MSNRMELVSYMMLDLKITVRVEDISPSSCLKLVFNFINSTESRN